MAYRKTGRELDRLHQRRQRVVTSACGVVQRAGFTAAKARDIAALAGMSVGSLYSHFGGIAEVQGEAFRLLAEKELQRVVRDVDAAACPAAALAALVCGFGTRALSAPVLAWALLLEPVAPNVAELRLRYRSDYENLASSIVREGIDAGEFAPQTVEISAPALVGAISESLVHPLCPGHSDTQPGASRSGSDSKLLEGIVEFCFRAVAANCPHSETPPPGPMTIGI